jgi:hypothetical protein
MKKRYQQRNPKEVRFNEIKCINTFLGTKKKEIVTENILKTEYPGIDPAKPLPFLNVYQYRYLSKGYEVYDGHDGFPEIFSEGLIQHHRIPQMGFYYQPQQRQMISPPLNMMNPVLMQQKLNQLQSGFGFVPPQISNQMKITIPRTDITQIPQRNMVIDKKVDTAEQGTRINYNQKLII